MHASQSSAMLSAMVLSISLLELSMCAVLIKVEWTWQTQQP